MPLRQRLPVVRAVAKMWKPQRTAFQEWSHQIAAGNVGGLRLETDRFKRNSVNGSRYSIVDYRFSSRAIQGKPDRLWRPASNFEPPRSAAYSLPSEVNNEARTGTALRLPARSTTASNTSWALTTALAGGTPVRAGSGTSRFRIGPPSCNEAPST